MVVVMSAFICKVYVVHLVVYMHSTLVSGFVCFYIYSLKSTSTAGYKHYNSVMLCSADAQG